MTAYGIMVLDNNDGGGGLKVLNSNVGDGLEVAGMIYQAAFFCVRWPHFEVP